MFEEFSVSDLRDWIEYYKAEIFDMEEEIREREKAPHRRRNANEGPVCNPGVDDQ